MGGCGDFHLASLIHVEQERSNVVCNPITRQRCIIDDQTTAGTDDRKGVDALLAIAACEMAEAGRLNKRTLVTTHMSNFGLELAMRERGIVPDVVVGHSVGEFSALAAAGALGTAEAIGLVRERYGVRPTLFAMLALLTSNAATSVAEFAGIAAALQLFGVSKYISVPIAAIVVCGVPADPAARYEVTAWSSFDAPPGAR